MQLGRIGQIQQSSAVVMHIEIENDLQGAYDLKWRGIALSNFRRPRLDQFLRPNSAAAALETEAIGWRL